MISIGKWMHEDGASEVPSPSRCLLMLAEAIADSAVPHGSPSSAAFRAFVLRSREALANAPNNQSMAAAVQEIMRGMEAHRQEVESQQRRHGDEMQSIIGLLTRALMKVADATASSSGHLREIEAKLAQASQIDDLRQLKAKLSESVAEICRAAERHEAESARLQEELRKWQEAGSCEASRQKLMVESLDEDPVTGLPGLQDAERYIAAQVREGHGVYVLVICLDRVEAVNARYGFATGDKALLAFSQHLAQQMHKTDELFRWRGPCWVMVLSRPGVGLEAVQEEGARIASARFEQSVQMDRRSILLNLTATWTILPVATPDDASVIGRRIDNFAAQQRRVSLGFKR